MDENNFDQQIQPTMTSSGTDPNQKVMSVGDWLITLIVYVIPCVGLILYIVWAFGNGNENRKNYCRACLIMAVVGIVLSIIISVFFGVALSEIITDMNLSAPY